MACHGTPIDQGLKTNNTSISPSLNITDPLPHTPLQLFNSSTPFRNACCSFSIPNTSLFNTLEISSSNFTCPLPTTPQMMLPPRLFCLHFFFLLGSCALRAASAASLHERDAATIRDIHTNLRDLPGSRFFDSWGASNPCVYAGVVCVPDDDDPDVLRVSVLTLGTGLADSPGLAGSLPSSLTELTGLTDLVLYPGRVTGAIPPDIGSGLRRLRLLSLSGNQLTGSIPESLAGLPDLHTLDLGNNRLQGPIPRSLLLRSSASLKVLILANNGGLSGEMPAEFASSRLFHVDLGRNSLTGELPPLPPTIRYLSVSSNSMRGSLDTVFRDGATPPADLAFLDLSMNYFWGAIPRAVFAVPSMSSLLLSRNNFTGTLDVPAFEPDTAPPWSVLDVSHNGISGAVPEALAAAGSLYVNNNRLSGEVPEAVAHSVFAGHMVTFYAQHNFLTGFPVPPLPLPDSAALCLSYNCMDLPSPATANGCPTIGGPLQARPADQCRSNAAADVDSSGGDG